MKLHIVATLTGTTLDVTVNEIRQASIIERSKRTISDVNSDHQIVKQIAYSVEDALTAP